MIGTDVQVIYTVTSVNEPANSHGSTEECDCQGDGIAEVATEQKENGWTYES